MPVLIEPDGVESQTYGSLKAHVKEVQTFPASKRTIMSILQNEQLVDALLEQDKSVLLVTIRLDKSPNSNDGYNQLSGKGYPGKLFAGSLCSGQIIVKDQNPISLIIPALKKITGLKP